MNTRDTSMPDPSDQPLQTTGAGQQMAVYDPTRQGGLVDDDTIDLREYWQVLVKRRWSVLAVAAIILTAALLTTLLTVPEYRATVQAQITSPGGGRVLAIDDFTSESARYQEYLNTQIEIIRSRALVEATVRNHPELMNSPDLRGEIRQRSVVGELRGLLGLLRGNDDSAGAAERLDPVISAANRLRERIQVTPVRNAELVNIAVVGFDPDFAAAAANALADQYMRSNMQRRVDAGTEARTFLEEQLNDLRIALERADQDLADFGRANRIADLDERLRMATTALRRFTDRLSEVEAELVQLEAWRGLINEGRVDRLGSITESAIIRDLSRRLLEARTQYVSLSERFLDSYPAVQETLARIESLEEEIINTVLTRYDNLQAQLESLQSAIERQENTIITLNERAVQFNILRREFTTNQELYDGLLQRMREIGVAAGIQENNISIIDRARAAARPFKPNLPRNLALGLVLGLMAGVGLALLLEFLDNTIRRVEDIERLVDRPVLGLVPLVKSPAVRPSLVPLKGEEARQAREQARQDSDDPEPSVAMLSAIRPASAVSESFRSLRTSLNFSTATGMPKIMMLTSASVAEGKTTAASNLAVVLAQNGARVLILDADLRKPRLHREFDVSRAPGLTDHIAQASAEGDNAMPIKATGIAGLSIMTSGSSTPNPAELLSSARMGEILNAMRQQFDHVVIDASPVLGLADALILSRQTDGLVFVAMAGETSKDSFRMSMKRLAQVQAPVLGVMLNGVDLDSPEYAYYSAYYYSYDSEGETPEDSADDRRIVGAG